MKEFFLQSSLYEDGKKDLDSSLSLAFISIDKELDLKMVSGCDDFLKVCFHDFEIEKGRAYEALQKAIDLHREERLEAFSMFANDEVCEMTFSILKD